MMIDRMLYTLKQIVPIDAIAASRFPVKRSCRCVINLPSSQSNF
jgi:hypothetical protein